MPAQKQQFKSMDWPSGGLSEHASYNSQEQANPYFGIRTTCVGCLNVRSYDPATQRMRGAQRSGHSRYLAAQCNGSAAIQHVTQVVSASVASGASMRTNLGLCVAGGTVKSFTSAGFNSTAAGAGALSSTFPYINSAFLLGKVYFVDGTNYKYWDSTTDTMVAWTESTGNSLPSSGSNAARLICAYRGRILTAGIVGQGQNWFMSAVGDPTNYNYAPVPVSETMAVAGNNALSGQCQDVINALMPFSDDLVMFGGDHSLWQMTGDPAAGGRLDLVSDITGVAYGTAFCKDPNGVLYFFGGHGGFWMMAPGGMPTRLSAERIENRLATIDLSANVIRLIWDDRSQSVMIYVTPISGGTTTNYVYDTRNKAFWPDTFANANHNALSAHLMQGDLPSDRVLILGCYDGYLRFVDLSAKNDDGTAVNSYVYFGPITGTPENAIRLHQMTMELSTPSDPVRVDVYDGASPQEAFEKTVPRFSAATESGRNTTEQRWARGNAIYIKLGNSALGQSWQFESLVVSTQLIGRGASRAF